MKRIIIASVITIVFLVGVVFSRFSIYGNRIIKIKIKDNIFRAEAVSSDSKKEKGLGNRRGLCKDCAMIFIFSERNRWGFWMKEMNFNLDIIWIDGDKIVKIEKNVDKNSKEKIYPEFPANKVLELNAGVADKIGIETGDLVKIENY